MDRRILRVLQADARTPLAEVGRRVGLSQPSVSERVQRLHDRGVLKGYRAHIDPAAVGLGIEAFVRLRTGNEMIETCLASFEGIPAIVQAYRVTGEDCFVLRVLVQSPEELERVTDRVARFGAVTTSLVFNCYIDRGPRL